MSESFCKDCPKRASLITAMYAEAVQASAMTGEQIQASELDIPIDNSACGGVDTITEKRTGILRILGDKVVSVCTKPTVVRIPEQTTPVESAIDATN